MEHPRRFHGLGALRSVVTLLVIAHHAVLAYFPFAPPPPARLAAPPQWWRAFPVVDGERWSGFLYFVAWNDTFFMALMFFLSGLFVWDGLRRRGAAGYARRRALRLGVPFVLAAGLLAPLAYLPSYLSTGAPLDLAAYAREWLATGAWASGPAWFLWVLLLLDLVAAALYAARPRPISAGWLARPAAAFAALLVAGLAAYVPLALALGAERWSDLGPFQFQTSRALHYALYFFAGVVVGAHGLDRGFLASGGPLARRAALWIALAAGVFVLSGVPAGRVFAGQLAWLPVMHAGFVLTCATTSFALLALFVRALDRPSRILGSLGANAYGMYVVHYAIVTWLQRGFLAAPLSGLEKGVLVTALAILASWAAVAAGRYLVAPRRPIMV